MVQSYQVHVDDDVGKETEKKRVNIFKLSKNVFFWDLGMCLLNNSKISEKNMLPKRLLRLLNKYYLTFTDVLLNNFHTVIIFYLYKQSSEVEHYHPLLQKTKLSSLSKMSHNFYPATWKWTCKENITRAGIEFSVPFTVTFLPFHRWGEMKLREVKMPTQC